MIRKIIRNSAESAIATFLAMDEDKNPLILRGFEVEYKYTESQYFSRVEVYYFKGRNSYIYNYESVANPMSDIKKHILEPEKWVSRYADYLYNYAITRVDSQEMAKDLVQETFFSGVKGKDSFRGQAAERTWLVSILKRKIIDHYRKINSAKGQKEVKMNFYEDGENKGDWIEQRVPQSWGNDADKEIENTELKDTLNKCIQSLPEKYRIVFVLKTVQNYETEEICNELGITSSNLWVIIHRARTQLRKCMEENWFNN